MGARERLLHQNQVMLGKLLHKLQIFQNELLHFITSMDDYFMIRAISLECIEFQKKLQNIFENKKDDHK